MAELVVAPKIVITVPMLVTPQLRAQQTITTMNVQTRFYFVVKLPLPSTSSIESFIGRVQNGDENATTRRIPNKQTYIATGTFPSGVANGASSMFCNSKIFSKVQYSGGLDPLI